MRDWYRAFWARSELGWQLLSTLLAPAEWMYGIGVATRGWAFDSGLLRARDGAIPTLVIGNLTVGGTGKTPISAWFAHTLLARGHQPAIVTRGYGGDEVEVHKRTNPGVPVYVAADRTAGVSRAQLAGADVAVLDDAFQHRALLPSASVVLLAAEEWTETPRLLPRGPWRERLNALERATLIAITRKTAPAARAEEVADRVKGWTSTDPARAHIAVTGLARYEAGNGSLRQEATLQGFECGLALAGVARPEAVWAQLDDLGVSAEFRWTYADHHRYTETDIANIRRRASGRPVVATLKDAVKLGPALGMEVDIYVPLQKVIWESGAEQVEDLIRGLSNSGMKARV